MAIETYLALFVGFPRLPRKEDNVSPIDNTTNRLIKLDVFKPQ